MPVGPDFISLQVRDLDAGPPGLGIAVWVKFDTAQALHDQLAADGVTIVTAPFDGPFGRTFAFADPDGSVTRSTTAHR